MKVVLINTLTPGGAFVACQRLYEALSKTDIDVSLMPIKATRYDFLSERANIWLANHLSIKNLFAVSFGNTGIDISRLPEVQKADIIHLHWVNHGALSLKNIGQLLQLGKPVVWTMHDMWPFTGICHHSFDCVQYQTRCTLCPQCRGKDAQRIFENKLQQWKNIHFVGCSRWIASLAQQSALTVSSSVCSIPNALDTNLYSPIDKRQARSLLSLQQNKKYVLFGAMNTASPIKGFSFLREADKLIKADNVEYLVFGKHGEKAVEQLSHKGVNLGYVSDEQTKRLIYSAADVFVTPSLADNLPNMIAESMACATPCVGFRIGGIPEMIDNGINGFVADYKDSAGLAHGIDKILKTDISFNTAARQKAVSTYAYPMVAQQYISLYQSLIAYK
jgi:glycosyltransferase involved in cell wall biosynthesis